MLSPRLVAGRYQLEELLGRGGMGAVYRGRDTHTGESVAVKELRDELHTAPDLLARFRREAESLRRLDHPGIVRMLDAFEDAGRSFLVMEYVPGGSLDDRLRQTPQLAPVQAASITHHLAEALTAVHRLKIIHRDIKPANVLLAADGTPRLTDFGAALVADGPRLTETGAITGTFAYLSPEVCQGEQPDTRADLWALGILLFELLAGRRPFAAPQPVLLLTSIIRDDAPDLRDVRPDTPPPLAALVAQMLTKDRNRRIASARLVAATLSTIVAQLGPLASSHAAPSDDEQLLKNLLTRS
jgi:serine/threonine-protein kinase